MLGCLAWGDAGAGGDRVFPLSLLVHCSQLSNLFGSGVSLPMFLELGWAVAVESADGVSSGLQSCFWSPFCEFHSGFIVFSRLVLFPIRLKSD